MPSEEQEIMNEFEQGQALYTSGRLRTYCENSDQESGYDNARENEAPRQPVHGRNFPTTGQTARQSAYHAGVQGWKDVRQFATVDGHEWYDAGNGWERVS